MRSFLALVMLADVSHSLRAFLTRWIRSATSIMRKVATPTGVTLGQSVDVVRKYLYLHPEQRHVAAAMLVVSALGAAWCKQ
jgi:hypothetical protein